MTHDETNNTEIHIPEESILHSIIIIIFIFKYLQYGISMQILKNLLFTKVDFEQTMDFANLPP